MTIRRLFILVAILTSCARGQEAGDPQREFDRLCFVDFLSSEATVGPDFSLKVSFRGTPVVGTRITLNEAINMSGVGVVATATTDSRGIARFYAVPPGSYHAASRDGLLFPSGSLEIEVKPVLTSPEKVEVEWPDSSIAVRNLRGKFGVSEHLDGPELPLRNASVELRDLRTARLLESVLTDANGDFEFTTEDSGLYALRLTLMKQGEPGFEYHDIAIELDPAAKEAAIPEMKAVQSNCAGVQLFRETKPGDWEQE